MSLLEQAEADLALVLEDAVGGFGQQITIRDPDGNSRTVIGTAGDVASVIDPETQALLTGATAHVCVRLSSLARAGIGVPIATADEARRPWRVSFSGRDGALKQYSVLRSLPDRTLGTIVLILTPHHS